MGGIITAARTIPAYALVQDRQRLAALRQQAREALAGADAMLLPTAPEHPTIAAVVADPAGVNARLGTYTNCCNLLDMCAVAVPTDVPSFGVTVMAPALADRVAADVARLLTAEAVPAPPSPSRCGPCPPAGSARSSPPSPLR